MKYNGIRPNEHNRARERNNDQLRDLRRVRLAAAKCADVFSAAADDLFSDERAVSNAGRLGS